MPGPRAAGVVHDAVGQGRRGRPDEQARGRQALPVQCCPAQSEAIAQGRGSVPTVTSRRKLPPKDAATPHSGAGRRPHGGATLLRPKLRSTARTDSLSSRVSSTVART